MDYEGLSKNKWRYNIFIIIISVLVATTGAKADLLVGSDGPPGTGALRHYDNNGVYLGDFTSGGPGLDGPAAVQFGPDGNLYILSGGDTVLRYDGVGSFIDVFIPKGSNGLDGASDMIFGPDGNLYISNNGAKGPTSGDDDGEVLRFNGKTGAFIDTFIKNGAGAGGSDVLCEAMSIAFGPDGNFYLGNDPRVCFGTTAYNVMRFDGTTGQYIDTPFPANFEGLIDPNGMTIGPDCNLYISSEGDLFQQQVQIDSALKSSGTANPNVIFRLNLKTGAIDEFVLSNGLLIADGPFPAGTGLIEPQKIVFGPDRNLYVTSGDTAEVYRYNDESGSLIGVFVTQGLGGLKDPKGLTFLPRETRGCVIPGQIPTLSEWGLITMTGVLGMAALLIIRRRKVTA